MSRRKAFLRLLLILLAWKIVRTDWIVSANCVFHDSDPPPSDEYFTGTYTPPVSPLFLPPRPQDIEPAATTWRHWKFFAMGGAGGPIEEPQLHIHWSLLLLKLAGGTLIGWFIIVMLSDRIRRSRM